MNFRQINITKVSEIVQESLAYALEIDVPAAENIKEDAEKRLEKMDVRTLESIIAKEYALQFVDELRKESENE